MDPMLASPTKMEEAPTFLDDVWWWQPKIDGERLLIVSDGAGTVTFYNRDGDRTTGPDRLRSEVLAMPVPMVLDGERLHDTFVVFDLVDIDGLLAGQALDARLNALEVLVSRWHARSVLMAPTARTVDEKMSMIDQVTVRNGEGWVAKRVESLYVPGDRGPTWRKLKRYRDVDCIVSWVGDPTQEGEKDNMGLALLDEDGVEVNVGECTRRAGTGMQVRKGDVVAVQILYATDKDRLYQPTRPRLRTDKPRSQCTLDQLETLKTDKDYVLTWDDAWKTT